MAWVVKKPKPWDFCGCPPCSICYDWKEPGAPAAKVTPGSIKLAMDLLGRLPQSDAELNKLQKVAETIHAKGVAGLTPEAPPDEGGAVFETATVDIGLTSLTRVNLFLKHFPKGEKRKPHRRSLDSIMEEQAQRKVEAKRMKAAMREEKKRIREMMKLMAGSRSRT